VFGRHSYDSAILVINAFLSSLFLLVDCLLVKNHFPNRHLTYTMSGQQSNSPVTCSTFLLCLFSLNAIQPNVFRPRSVAPCFSYEVLPWNLKHAPNMFADQAMTDMRL
jgi:hypothetical protein